MVPQLITQLSMQCDETDCARSNLTHLVLKPDANPWPFNTEWFYAVLRGGLL